MSRNHLDDANRQRRELRAARTYAEQKQQKEADRIRKANEWSAMTPEERRAKIMQQKKRREGIYQLVSNQWSTFSGANVWDVPGRDYSLRILKSTQKHLLLGLWYVNNGSWRDREVSWLVAYLHTVERLAIRVELANDGGVGDDIEDADDSLYEHRHSGMYIAVRRQKFGEQSSGSKSFSTRNISTNSSNPPSHSLADIVDMKMVEHCS